MTITGGRAIVLATSREVQEFLLAQPPGTLILVPHQRLAHQVWRRQRLAARSVGRTAWEPAALTTLAAWRQQLWRHLWRTQRPASLWQRLVCWLRAMEAVPPEPGVTVDLAWALLLDEAFDLCQRYRIPPPLLLEAESSLITWREAVFRKFSQLLTAQGLLTPAGMMAVLLEELARGGLRLPERLVLVGLEAPAPLEEEFLQELARRLELLQVHLTGPVTGEVDLQGVTLPERRQEMEWVAARALELAGEGRTPLHRIAITAPHLESYLPEWRRIWRELLGSEATAEGGRYNFSLGLTLAEAPLFQAAMLPLKFSLGGQERQDLVAWLRSPYYGAFRPHADAGWRWDGRWRQEGIGYGWEALREGSREQGRRSKEEGKNEAALAGLVDMAVARLLEGPATAPVWRGRLQGVWEALGFPAGVTPGEAGQWQALGAMLAEWADAGGDRLWSAGEMMAWLDLGAGQVDLASEGSSEAGLQIQGLLELRGLDYDVVFCLGMNMGVFPPPPRSLPLLTAPEKALVLGGDYRSQWEFARTSYQHLLAAAPRIILTRPLVSEDEEQLASPMVAPDVWEPEPRTFLALSRPHPGWLRSPAVQAAFAMPPAAGAVEWGEAITLPLPAEISLSSLEAALSCPCKFYLGVLLGLEPLPDVEPGLPASDRGQVIHKLLRRFTERFAQVLEDQGGWEDAAAGRHLEEVVAELGRSWPKDPHWEAEVARWLAGEGGVLREWLRIEKERYQEGWRWRAMEEPFGGLGLTRWPTRLKGRLDRVDSHATQGLMLWDYKTGAVPGKKELQEERHCFQLLAYLLAVRQGLTRVDPQPEIRAGFIGLKSSRQKHLQFQDFKFTGADWQGLLEARLAEVAELGDRVDRGDFHPDPSPAPPRRNNACKFCPFGLLCGHGTGGADESGEDE